MAVDSEGAPWLRTRLEDWRIRDVLHDTGTCYEAAIYNRPASLKVCEAFQ